MAAKIRLEIDDATDAGAKAAADSVEQIGVAADKTEKQFEEAAAASKKLNDTAEDSKKLGASLTEINSGLEILKKGFEVAGNFISSQADKGNRSFRELQSAIGRVQAKINDLAKDPALKQFAEDAADAIDNQLIPAMQGMVDIFQRSQNGWKETAFAIGEGAGLIDKAVRAEIELGNKVAAQNKAREDAEEAAAEKRLTIIRQISTIQQQVAEDERLAQLAKLEGEGQITAAIENEREALEELAKANVPVGEESEQRLNRIMTLERRLAEVRRQSAEDDIQQQADAAKARDDLAKSIADAERAKADAAAKVIDDKIAEARRAFDALTELIGKASGQGGGNLLQQARGQLTPEQVRAQLVRKAQEEAGFQASTEGKSIAQQRAASRQAGIQAFQQFNRGQTSQADIVEAQNTLVNSQAQAAQSRGDLDAQTVQAIAQAANNQQQLVATQEAQAQQLAQIQAALGGVGNSAQRAGQTARAQRGGFGR